MARGRWLLRSFSPTKMDINKGLRKLRAWFYRRYPATGVAFRKKLTGYERVLALEDKGFTKQEFFDVMRQAILNKLAPGRFLEIVAGDGLVGSFGVWLETLEAGWRIEAWEHRPQVAASFARNRPAVPLHRARWGCQFDQEAFGVTALTIRGSREASVFCRELLRGGISPQMVGIWNPSRRPIWYQRLTRRGYRLCVVWHNMEFYLHPSR